MDISLIHDLIVVAMAILGVCLTLLPPRSSKWKVIFIIGFSLLAILGVVVSHLERKEANADHKSELDNQQNKINELLKSNERLEKSTQRQEQILAPILALLKERYPNLPPFEALEKLQSEMKQLKTRTSTLEQKTAYRDLTLSQKNALIENLLPYKGRKIIIHAIMGDTEIKHFAEVFKEIFEKAGWLVEGVTTTVYEPSPVGINIYIGKYPSEDGQIIYNAFKAIGLLFQPIIDRSMKSEDVVLTIGPRKQE